jgi:hypothetical protein
MKKAYLFIVLFLCFGMLTDLSAVELKRHVVGTGGFVGRQVSSSLNVSGIFGQTFISRNDIITQTGDPVTISFGFWAPIKRLIGIEDEFDASKMVSNYPNPVKDQTTFVFNLVEASFVTINVYNGLGVLVASVANEEVRPAGINQINWNVSSAANDNLSSGAYSYQLFAIPLSSNSSSKTISQRGSLMISK